MREPRRSGVAAPLLFAAFGGAALAVLSLTAGGGFLMACLAYTLGGSVLLLVAATVAARRPTGDGRRAQVARRIPAAEALRHA